MITLPVTVTVAAVGVATIKLPFVVAAAGSPSLNIKDVNVRFVLSVGVSAIPTTVKRKKSNVPDPLNGCCVPKPEMVTCPLVVVFGVMVKPAAPDNVPAVSKATVAGCSTFGSKAFNCLKRVAFPRLHASLEKPCNGVYLSATPNINGHFRVFALIASGETPRAPVG